MPRCIVAAPPRHVPDDVQEEFEAETAHPGVVNEALEDDPFKEDPLKDV